MIDPITVERHDLALFIRQAELTRSRALALLSFLGDPLPPRVPPTAASGARDACNSWLEKDNLARLTRLTHASAPDDTDTDQ